MANYKRVILTERKNTVSEKSNVKPKVEKNTIKSQLSKFDTSYKNDKLNELYDEFDSITLNSPSISDLTVKQPNVTLQTNEKVDFKSKIYLSSAIMVTILLAFLTIFNIFVINNLNGGIKLLQQDVVSAELNLKDLYDTYKDLNNVSKLEQRVQESGFVELPENSIESIELIEITPPSTPTVQTNWFDRFCDFLSNILGG